MQHFSASLPHLAMALADMHLNLGGGDPLFVKTQVGSWVLLWWVLFDTPTN